MLDGVEFGNEVVALVRGYVEREIAPLKAENEELKGRIAALEARPAPEKGEKGDDGLDGMSPDPEAVIASLLPSAQELIAAEVEKAITALPPAEKGEPGERGEKGEPGERGADGKDGSDGRGVRDLLIDREGALVATMDDGEMKNLGPIVGADGKRGKDGRDGFGFDDMEVNVADDDRTIELGFRRGDELKVFSLKWPTQIYRGVFKEGAEYDRGDIVTWAGSQWHCDEPTTDKPGTEKWTLAVKKGRDGKDAKQ